MSLRVISAPPHFSMYQRAISPPMEWHTNTTWASAYGPPWSRHRCRAGSMIVPSRWALYRQDSRQS